MAGSCCCRGEACGGEVGSQGDGGSGDAKEVGGVVEEGGFGGDYGGVVGEPGAVGDDGGWRGGGERAG